MKNILQFAVLYLSCFLGFNTQLQAQATNATCQNATMIGAVNPTYVLPVNQPAPPAGNNYACLGSQPNPLWFFFELSGAGSLTLALSNTSNVDVDFILYGPFASASAALAGCGNLGNGGTGATVVDCSYSAAANELVDIINGNAGEFYMLLVTNFSNQGTTGNTQIVQNGGTATMTNPYVGAPVVQGTCTNSSNGSISTTVTNGTAPYFYNWSNGETTADISGLSAGTYGLTVTDANGATFANSSILVPSFTSSNVNNTISICNGDSAFIFGAWRSTVGIYRDTVANPSGCDSIFNTTLIFNQNIISLYYDLCSTDSIFAGGAWQFTTGIYYDTIRTANNCDSLIETTVYFYTCSPVWAGDADDNLIVDGNDWLQLGFVNGLSSFARANASINWVAQPAIDWGTLVNAVETKHADCNGDGVVNGDDSLAIIQNYSLTHVRDAANFVVNTTADVQLIPQQNTYNVGDLVKIDVVLGQSSFTLFNAYGYFFKIDVGNIFRAGSLQFTPNSSFLGTAADVWTLSKELNAVHQIDISQVRHNLTGASGFGKVGEISFILNNNAGNTNPVLGFVTNKIVNNNNVPFTINTSAATFNVNPTSVQNINNYNFAAKVVPNPVSDNAFLQFDLAENSPETKITVINSLGQIQHSQLIANLQNGNNSIELQTNFPAGTYFVEIKTGNYTTRVPFIKL
jgi:Secretion system C-terminal sorting domain/SprB repeat